MQFDSFFGWSKRLENAGEDTQTEEMNAYQFSYLDFLFSGGKKQTERKLKLFELAPFGWKKDPHNRISVKLLEVNFVGISTFFLSNCLEWNEGMDNRMFWCKQVLLFSECLHRFSDVFSFRRWKLRSFAPTSLYRECWKCNNSKDWKGFFN